MSDYQGPARPPRPFNVVLSPPYRRSLTGAVRAESEEPAAIGEIGMASEYEDRKRLTFEQAEGAEPLPTQLQLREVSGELRARLWSIFYKTLEINSSNFRVREPLLTILYDLHVERWCRPADEFNSSVVYWVEELKGVFMEGDYIQIFGLTQWMLRRPHMLLEGDLDYAHVDDALHITRAAYAVFDRDTIIPIGSEAERDTLARAFADLATSEFRGARAHLRNAGSELTTGNYGPSIRESIHAVEAVARVLETSAGTLGPALSKLEKSVRIHPALGNGFRNLYGFTSDEKGNSTRAAG
jgi:hypothetical protein